jgi:rare lipoprotein A (peptidoglycan hydrolase)
MLALWLVLLLALSTAVHAETGIASHYSSKDRDQNGTKTACGPHLRDSGLTMAHRRLPCGTRVSLGAARAIGLFGSARVTLAH